MGERIKRARTGVIIGRFQVDEITGGHKQLIEEVLEMHDRVLILVGVSPTPVTMADPLDYATREKMIKSVFPSIICLPIADCRTDEEWSANVDAQIRSIFPIGSVCIYGGRDSFLPYYHGQMDACEFPASDYRPGADIREEIGNIIPNGRDGRRGVIYATQNTYPIAYFCVDVIIQNHKNGQIIAGMRPNEGGLYRLPGGFVDPGETLEMAAAREVLEEVGCGIGKLNYITSMAVADWRFKKGPNKLTTALFATEYLHGPVSGGDDLPRASWVDIGKVKFVPEHTALINHFLSWRGERDAANR